MGEFWFKAMRIEALEVGIKADSEEEAKAILAVIYGDHGDPAAFSDSKLRFVSILEGSGIVVGDPTNAPVHEQDAMTVPRLASFLGCPESAAIDWSFDNHFRMGKLATPDNPADEMVTRAHAQEVSLTDAHLLYIPRQEEDILSRLPARAILVMFADEVGRNSFILHHVEGEIPERMLIADLLKNTDIVWPMGISIRQHEGQAQVVDRAGRVILSTF